MKFAFVTVIVCLKIKRQIDAWVVSSRRRHFMSQ